MPKKTHALAAWLSAAEIPIFLLDQRRTVLFFNRGCEECTGWQAGEVIGRVCEYNSVSDPEQVEFLTNTLCPPPELFTGEIVCQPVVFYTRSQVTQRRRLLFIPLKEASQNWHILGLWLPWDAPQTVPSSIAQELHAELGTLRRELKQTYRLDGFVAGSSVMRRVLDQMKVASSCRSSLHLLGAKGTGKEQLARTVHFESEDRGRAFIPVDCRQPHFELKRSLKRALDAEHQDSTVLRLRPGTLYLKDVESLPRDLQEILVEQYSLPLDKRPSVRLISASTESLSAVVDRDQFSPDCLFLLTTLAIELPLLRHRLEDLPLLAQHLLEQTNRGADHQIGGMNEEVASLFQTYNWPGNEDELALVIREAVALCKTPLLTPADLPFRFRTGWDAQSVGPPQKLLPMPLDSYLEQIEADRIREVLMLVQGNRSRAADLLEIPRAKLYRRLETLGITSEPQAEEK